MVNDADGQWQVRVVPNKYPAVGVQALACSQDSLKAELQHEDQPKPGLQLVAPPHGIHEVVIESPRHVRDWADLSNDQLATVLRTFRDRIDHAYANHQMRSVLVFKNVGEAAGASLEHVHTQLVAFPYVSEVLEREVQVSTGHYDRTGECLMCGLVGEELRSGTRLVSENDAFAAFTAFAGRQPYETWIVPKHHASCFTLMSNEESQSLALILTNVIRQLHSVRDLRHPPAYNAVLHTAPAGHDRSADHAVAAAFHWHWELIPRSTSLAGFEWGTGMYINSVSPERAAIRMRKSKSGENLPIQ